MDPVAHCDAKTQFSGVFRPFLAHIDMGDISLSAGQCSGYSSQHAFAIGYRNEQSSFKQPRWLI